MGIERKIEDVRTYPWNPTWRIEPSSWQNAADILNHFRNEKSGSLSDGNSYWVSNLAFYSVVGGVPVFSPLPEEYNPFLKESEHAMSNYNWFINFYKENFKLQPQFVEEVIQRSSKQISLISKDFSYADNNSTQHFLIDTSSPYNLPDDQLYIAQWVLGQGEDFKQNIQMFQNNGIRSAKIELLHPREVKALGEGRGILRMCFLDISNSEVKFDASYKPKDEDVYHRTYKRKYTLRGEPRKPKKENTFEKLLKFESKIYHPVKFIEKWLGVTNLCRYTMVEIDADKISTIAGSNTLEGLVGFFVEHLERNSLIKNQKYAFDFSPLNQRIISSDRNMIFRRLGPFERREFIKSFQKSLAKKIEETQVK